MDLKLQANQRGQELHGRNKAKKIMPHKSAGKAQVGQKVR